VPAQSAALSATGVMAAGETVSDRLRRYAEGGARRDEQPMTRFRDGPSGRRAGLIGGPDVREIGMWIDDLSGVPDAADTLAREGVISRGQIDAALKYRGPYPDEVQAPAPQPSPMTGRC
jgi:hypothetical protein